MLAEDTLFVMFKLIIQYSERKLYIQVFSYIYLRFKKKVKFSPRIFYSAKNHDESPLLEGLTLIFPMLPFDPLGNMRKPKVF